MAITSEIKVSIKRTGSPSPPPLIFFDTREVWGHSAQENAFYEPINPRQSASYLILSLGHRSALKIKAKFNALNKMNRIKTDFLCTSSSFLTGLGSVLNLNGQHHVYNSCDNPDEIAIAADWRMIGQDIKDALARAKTEAQTPSPVDH